MEETVVKPRQESADPLRRELERAQIHGPDNRTIDALEDALDRPRTVCIGENIVAMLRAGKDVVLEDQGITLIRASDLQQTVSEIGEKQIVWDMLLLDGNCSDHTLHRAAKLRRILDDLIEARQMSERGYISADMLKKAAETLVEEPLADSTPFWRGRAIYFAEQILRNTPGGLNRDVSAGTSHSESDGSATKPAISRSEDGASQGAAPIPLSADANGKRPRLFYFEETENCWCPAEGLEVENIISADSFLSNGEIIEIQFKREDMMDAEFDVIPEG